MTALYLQMLCCKNRKYFETVLGSLNEAALYDIVNTGVAKKESLDFFWL